MSEPAGRRAFLLGQHISHSLSPVIHNPAFRAVGLDCRYELLDVPRSELEAALERLRGEESLGANVTMPYKRDVLVAADERSEAVERCGAGNLLVNRGGTLSLYNTDVEAIAACLARQAPTVATGTAILVGAGGSAAAILEALRRVPPRRVRVLARRLEAARELARRAGEWLPAPIEVARLSGTEDEFRDAVVVFNATPLGMNEDDPSPVPLDALRPGLLVYDIVYRRSGLTRLQAEALARGSLVCDGADHLLQQALPTFRLLTGVEPPESVMREALVGATGREPLDWGRA